MKMVIEINTGIAIYHLDKSFVARDRANWYASNYNANFKEKFENTMNCDFKAIDWLMNNMSFEEIKDKLVLVKKIELNLEFWNDINNFKEIAISKNNSEK